MNISRFYSIEQEKLFLEFEKISLFTNHPPTLGSYRESVLREYLKSFTSDALRIKSGFVANYKKANECEIFKYQTKQIDCLIYDSNNYVSLLQTDDFAIIQPEALFAAIEVKSSLTFYKQYKPKKSKETDEDYPFGGSYTEAYRWTGTMVDALSNIKSVSDVTFKDNPNFFSGVLAYTVDFDPHTLYHAFDNGELQIQLGINHLSQLPNYICIPKKHIIRLGATSMFEKGEHCEESYLSHFDCVNAVQQYDTFPLQLFSAAYNQNIKYKFNKSLPVEKGFFDPSSGIIEFWHNHFELDSEGMD